jgi:iron complex outermembrane receptor protein
MSVTPLRRRLAPCSQFLSGCLAFAAASGPILAQTAPAPSAVAAKLPATEEAVELSPFVTTANSEVGYVATSSLAGSRVNTPLKDIAAQIDIMTPEFLADIAAISLDDAVVFSTNNGGPAEQNTGPNDGTQSTRASGRARGFDAISNSSDFYATNFPSDLYNVERITIANGPQSILFGLGNAGGAIDTATKRAVMNDKAELSFRTDSHNSLRTVLDVNRQLVPKKVALRLVGVKSDINDAVDGAYNNQHRAFGTVSWRIGDRTSVRLSAERMVQKASLPTNRLSYDFLSPWANAGRPLYDNSTGNTPITAAAFPLLNRNTNALRVVAYDGSAAPSVLVWNGTGLTRGPHQLASALETRPYSIVNDALFPIDAEPRVGGRINRLSGTMLRGAIEHRFTPHFFLELGFNYESLAELRGGPFSNAESINVFADPNRYLPGGTAARPNTTPNPNVGRMYIETFPNATEFRARTQEVRLTSSYEYDFGKEFKNVARWFGRHRLAGLVSKRIDQDKSQDSRAIINGDTSFTTADLLNNSRFIRSRFYFDPAHGGFTAQGIPGGADPQLGPWTLTDGATNQTFTATTFDHPAGRTSAAAGTKKDVNTYMLALQSFFWKERVNVFAGRRIDDFKNYQLDPKYLIRGDQLAPGDKRGLYTPLSRTTYDSTPQIDDRGTTYSYGGVIHVQRWLSLFASKSDNTALPPGFLDPDNRPVAGVFSDGYDYGFRTSLKDDAISLRVNLYQEHQHSLIGDGQAVRTASATVEQRLRGSDRPAGIATVAADGFDPVTRGDVYRSVEDKIGRGMDITLTARLASNWDLRAAVGQQKTRVFNKSAEFNAWVARRLPVWQSFGGLGWDRVAISTTDSRTVHQFYDQDVATEIVRSQLRNNLPRYRQREWRGSLFSNYRFTEGPLKRLNLGGGLRWTDRSMIGFVQRPYPDGTTGDDVTKPLFGKAQTFVDLLAGYGGKTKFFGGRQIGWRLQLNIRNLLEDNKIEPVRSDRDSNVLEWGRIEPRQIVLNASFTF